MARAKVTREMIEKMYELYQRYRSYAAVAKEVGVSNSTAAKYIKSFVPYKTYETYDGPAPSLEPQSKERILSFSNLSAYEREGYIELMKEYGFWREV